MLVSKSGGEYSRARRRVAACSPVNLCGFVGERTDAAWHLEHLEISE
jgi:hypothetical protein